MQAATQAAFEPPARVQLARLPAGAIRHRDMRTWERVIAQMPEDRLRRGVFADWLEEKGMHHSDEDLARLRSHDGPLFVVRHPRTKKVVAVPGHPITDLGALRHLARTHDRPMPLGTTGVGDDFVHGPRYIVRVRPALAGMGTVIEYYNDRGGRIHPTRDEVWTGTEYHPERQAALRIAQRVAFGE